MAKPRLVKVRALFYVLQQVMKRGCIGILIHPLLTLMKKTVIRFWFYLLSGNQWMHILTTSEPLRSR